MDKEALYHALIADTVREFTPAASAAIEMPGPRRNQRPQS
jgi:hypothetical protein